MPRTQALALGGAALFALAACDHSAFDHSRAQGRLEADAAPANDCRTAGEGTPCDDRDICTPRSACRAGACFGENPFDTCVVADTVEDFSSEQGKDGWFYGSWAAASDADGKYDPATDFRSMDYCRENTWLPEGRCEAEQEWTQNLSHGLQHAETRPVLELPVRRWVSDVSGPARISIEHHAGGPSGDGTRALLLLDGVEIWRHDAEPGADASTAVLAVELEQGSLLEQLIHPRQGQDEDMSYFSITLAP